MSYGCGKRYCVCVTCMKWCSNTKSVPLLVSNLHDIILVHTQYVLVCTCLYHYTRYVPVRTRYVLVRTGTYQIPCDCTTGHDFRCLYIEITYRLPGIKITWHIIRLLLLVSSRIFYDNFTGKLNRFAFCSQQPSLPVL